MDKSLKASIKAEMIENIKGYFRDLELPGVSKFIHQNNSKIDQCVDQMFNDYLEDLSELESRQPDWVREYMEEIFEQIGEL